MYTVKVKKSGTCIVEARMFDSVENAMRFIAENSEHKCYLRYKKVCNVYGA